MVAAGAADLDGIGILFGQEAYWDYHHKLGHNAAFGVLLCALLTKVARGRARVFLAYLALFHLHLVMDFFGSGPGWPIAYLWPFSARVLDNRRWSWAFYSWQNIGTAGLLIGWTIAIAVRAGRTPLEIPMPALDRQLVDRLRRLFRVASIPRQESAAPSD